MRSSTSRSPTTASGSAFSTPSGAISHSRTGSTQLAGRYLDLSADRLGANRQPRARCRNVRARRRALVANRAPAAPSLSVAPIPSMPIQPGAEFATAISGIAAMKTTAPPDPNPCRPRHFKPGPCGPAPQEGPAKQSLETSHTRLLITGALFCLAFLVIGGRLVEVAGFKGGDARIARVVPGRHTLAGRADIVDRNGVLLATTLETPSLYADPKASAATRAMPRGSSCACCPISTRPRSTPSSPRRTAASSGSSAS